MQKVIDMRWRLDEEVRRRTTPLEKTSASNSQSTPITLKPRAGPRTPNREPNVRPGQQAKPDVGARWAQPASTVVASMGLLSLERVTSMRRGLARSASGIVTVSTPFS